MKLSGLLIASFLGFTFAQSSLNSDLIGVSVEFPGAEKAEDGSLLLTNGEQAKLQFVVSNEEASDLIVAGYGGSISEKKTPDVVYNNLTGVKLEPTVANRQSPAVVDHMLQVALPPTDFLLKFILYVQFGEDIMTLQLSPLSITVVDPPISNWDPKLILVQLILGATATVGGYYLSTKLIVPYFDSKTGKTKSSKSKKSSNPDASGVKKAAGKNYDESWIPEQHLKKAK